MKKKKTRVKSIYVLIVLEFFLHDDLQEQHRQHEHVELEVDFSVDFQFVTEFKAKTLTPFENEIKVSFLLIVKYHYEKYMYKAKTAIKIAL